MKKLVLTYWFLCFISQIKIKIRFFWPNLRNFPTFHNENHIKLGALKVGEPDLGSAAVTSWVNTSPERSVLYIHAAKTVKSTFQVVDRDQTDTFRVTLLLLASL